MSEEYKSRFSGKAFDSHNVSGFAQQTIAAVCEDDDGEVVRYLPVDKVEGNFFQFRKVFEGIEELGENIKEHGIIHPLIVFRRGDKYVISCGERRYRAAVYAGLKKVPCIIKTKNPATLDEINFIENVQRSSFKNLERYCAIHEFDKRGYKAERIMHMSGDKQKSSISKSSAIGQFANNVCAAGFTNFVELVDVMESITQYVLYRIAKIAEHDMELAYSTMMEIYNKKIPSAQALHLTQTVIAKLGMQEDDGNEDIPSGEAAETYQNAEAFIENVMQPQAQQLAAGETASFGVATSAVLPESKSDAQTTLSVPAHTDVDFVIDMPFERADVTSAAYVSADNVQVSGDGNNGADDASAPCVSVKQEDRPGSELGITEAPVAPKKKEKIVPEYNELDWPDTKVSSVSRQLLNIVDSLSKMDNANVIVTDRKKAAKLMLLVKEALDRANEIAPNLAKLHDKLASIAGETSSAQEENLES